MLRKAFFTTDRPRIISPRPRPRPRLFGGSSVTSTRPAGDDVRTYFDHETLDVYQLELQFITWGTPLLTSVKQQLTGVRIAEVLDQLDRASLSALLNTAEGNGRRQRRTRAKFFDDARGSASECAACLDALVPKGICTAQEIDNGKRLLLRITSILTKLIQRFDLSVSSSSSSSIVREEGDEQVFEDEEEEDEKNE